MSKRNTPRTRPLFEIANRIRNMKHGDQFVIHSNKERNRVYDSVRAFELSGALNGLRILTEDNKDGTFTVSALRKGA